MSVRLPRGRRLLLMAVALGLAAPAAFLVPTLTAAATTGSAARPSGPPTSGLLDHSKFLIRSIQQINESNHTARLPLHKGEYRGQTVWFILTEASDAGIAADLNINFASKLANAAVSCAACVQHVTLTSDPNLKFGEGVVHFAGIPDFSPTRVLDPGPGVFPPATARPGAVAGPGYSPFIQIEGSPVVYNAPIVAVGDGRFDVTKHTNTSDRLLAFNPAKPVRGGQFSFPTADFLYVSGFAAGQPIIYLSTETSDALAATLERSTFIPLLRGSSFLGGDDTLGSVRERIFVFTNGQTGAGNPNAQGIRHLILDGHASEDASLANRPLINSLRSGGDLLNVLGDVPTLVDPRHGNAYSPLWDAQFGEWTHKAVARGLNTRQTDENQILNIAATSPGLLTGPGGADYGSVGFVINCPILAFEDQEPTADLVGLVPFGQG